MECEFLRPKVGLRRKLICKSGGMHAKLGSLSGFLHSRQHLSVTQLSKKTPLLTSSTMRLLLFLLLLNGQLPLIQFQNASQFIPIRQTPLTFSTLCAHPTHTIPSSCPQLQFGSIITLI